MEQPSEVTIIGQAAPMPQPPMLPATSDSVSLMNIIEQAAARGDVATLEKLMDLRDRDQDRAARLAFDADFVRMKPHLPKVVRTKENTQTKSKYAPLENINEAVDKILGEYGFGSSANLISQTDAGLTVKVGIKHSGGYSETTEVYMPLDNKGIAGTVNKTGPHAISSSIMYARRVGLCLLLNISTGDDTDGNGAADLVTQEQAIEIDRLIKESNANRAQFFKLMNVEEPDSRKILAKDYRRAINSLNAKIAANAKKKGAA